MRLLFGIAMVAIAVVALNIFSWNSIFFMMPIGILGIMMLQRGGWKYVSTDRNDPWNGKQYQFSEDGQNYVVKDGVTYRQAKELGRAPGYDWGEPENWEKAQKERKTKVVKAKVRR